MGTWSWHPKPSSECILSPTLYVLGEPLDWITLFISHFSLFLSPISSFLSILFSCLCLFFFSSLLLYALFSSPPSNISFHIPFTSSSGIVKASCFFLGSVQWFFSLCLSPKVTRKSVPWILPLWRVQGVLTGMPDVSFSVLPWKCPTVDGHPDRDTGQGSQE